MEFDRALSLGKSLLSFLCVSALDGIAFVLLSFLCLPDSCDSTAGIDSTNINCPRENERGRFVDTIWGVSWILYRSARRYLTRARHCRDSPSWKLERATPQPGIITTHETTGRSPPLVTGKTTTNQSPKRPPLAKANQIKSTAFPGPSSSSKPRVQD